MWKTNKARHAQTRSEFPLPSWPEQVPEIPKSCTCMATPVGLSGAKIHLTAPWKSNSATKGRFY